jgi:hypothetical protein
MPLGSKLLLANLHLGLAGGIKGCALRLLAHQTMFARMILNRFGAP